MEMSWGLKRDNVWRILGAVPSLWVAKSDGHRYSIKQKFVIIAILDIQ